MVTPRLSPLLALVLCVVPLGHVTAQQKPADPDALLSAVEVSKGQAAFEAARKALVAARFLFGPEKVQVSQDPSWKGTDDGITATSTDSAFPVSWAFSSMFQPPAESNDLGGALSLLVQQGKLKARFHWRLEWLGPGAYRTVIDKVEYGTVDAKGLFTGVVSNLSDPRRPKIGRWDFWADRRDRLGANLGDRDAAAAAPGPERFDDLDPAATRDRRNAFTAFDRATKAVRTVSEASRPTRNWKATPAVASAVPVPLEGTFNLKAAFALEEVAHAPEFDLKMGRAYSSALVGSSLRWDGVEFLLGPSNLLNAVRPLIQVIPLPNGRFQNLLFLASANIDEGQPLGLEVRYTDGTVDKFERRISAWDAPANFPGETKVGTYAYRLWKEGSRDPVVNHLYGYTLELDSTKVVVDVRLSAAREIRLYAASLLPPVEGKRAVGGLDPVQPPAARILQHPLPLAASFNLQSALRQDGLPTKFPGLDGRGYSLVADRWEDLIFDPSGPVFQLGPVTGKNAVESRGQSVELPPGRYSQAWVLALSTKGVQKAVAFETVFADGTVRKTTVDIADWLSPDSAQKDELVETAPFLLAPSGGKVFLGVSLYKYAVPVGPQKGGAATALRLPNNSNVKILAITLLEAPEVPNSPVAAVAAPAAPAVAEATRVPAPGQARQVAHGLDGSVWKIGTTPREGGFDVAFWNGRDWKTIDAGAVRLVVDASGVPTLVTDKGKIMMFFLSQPANKESTAGFFLPFPSKPAEVPTSDLAFDPSKNSVWRLDRQKGPGGFGIWYQEADGRWKQVDGAAVRIAMDQEGLPWVINDRGAVYRRTGPYAPEGSWQEVAGSARDFVVGPDGSLSLLVE